MTRQHTLKPVWAWYCDECNRPAGHLAWDAQSLPSADTMRERGWFIAKLFGDLCPSCVAKQASASSE